ncbi:MAG: conjugal transfer protein TraG N-terminal domain-containing protein [Methyloprofundus sp.]|nr:conjugal transfer protein TraG N-terminal domain-containing protein [Methyloprofundus sp.]
MFTSDLAIILTSLGWSFFNAIVDPMFALGLVFLPFIYIVIVNWYETSRSMNAGVASQVETKRTFFDLIVVMFIVFLFYAPSQNHIFNAAERLDRIHDSADGDGDIAREYADVETEAYMPVGWYFVINFTDGLVTWAKSNIKIESTHAFFARRINSMNIQDQDLRRETEAFFAQCYAPALRDYTRAEIKPQPESDIDYIGNATFLEAFGFYANCADAGGNCANRFSNGYSMSVDTYRWLGFDPAYQHASTQVPGRTITISLAATCKDWWLGSRSSAVTNPTFSHPSLRDRLYDEAVSHFLVDRLIDGGKSDTTVTVGKLVSIPVPAALQAIFNFNDTRNEERMITNLVANTNASIMRKEMERDSQGFWTTLRGNVGQFFTDAFTTITTGKLVFTLSMIKNILPTAVDMIVSVGLMAIVFSMSISLIVGGFRFSTLAKHIVLVLGIGGLHIVFHIAMLIDNRLLPVFFGIDDLFDMEINPIFFLYLVFLFLIYLVLPTWFIKTMAAAGAQVESGVSDMYNKGSMGSLGSGVGMPKFGKK